MTNEEIKEWRVNLGWTAKQAAYELGVSYSMYRLYETGIRHGRPVEIPRTVELSCAALAQLPEERRS